LCHPKNKKGYAIVSRSHGRWAFHELTDVWEIEEDFADKVQEAFEQMLANHG